MEHITYNDFKKLDIRIGKILSAEPVENADKLYKLEVDVGEETPRTLVAGMRPYYSAEELPGKKIVVLLNLEPRKIRGILSNGMLLAASTEGYETVKLLTVDGDIPEGSVVS